MSKQKTAIKTLIETIRRRFPEKSQNIEWIISQCEEAKKEERAQIVAAWIQGNEDGWAQTTDWPEHGERYYQQTFETT